MSLNINPETQYKPRNETVFQLSSAEVLLIRVLLNLVFFCFLLVYNVICFFFICRYIPLQYIPAWCMKDIVSNNLLEIYFYINYFLVRSCNAIVNFHYCIMLSIVRIAICLIVHLHLHHNFFTYL